MVGQGLVNEERSPDLKQAERQVDRFVYRFQPNYRLLAYYAALPLILTPELLHYLRIRFLRREGVPWVAEVDLLLSDLCQPVGYEQYAMDTAIRAYLLQEMEQQFGRSRMIETASLLIRYVEELARTNALSEQELEAQHLAALLILDEEQAVRQVATAYSHALSHGKQGGLSRASRTELARLSSLTQELAPQIKQHENLVNYARAIQQLLTNTYPANSNLFQRSFPILGDLELSIPDDLVPTEKRIQPDEFPPLQEFEFEVATIAVDSVPDTPPGIDLQPFEFEIVTLERRQVANPEFEEAFQMVDQAVVGHSGEHLSDVQQHILRCSWEGMTYGEMASTSAYTTGSLKRAGTKLWQLLSDVFTEEIKKTNIRAVLERLATLGGEPGLVIHRQQQQGWEFVEVLGEETWLEMVRIPGGSFVMGAPKTEAESTNAERPQHDVRIQPFFIGKYPVTQAEWKAVAALPQVNRELDPDPSRFKGSDRPIERISWYDAVEFCDRLSQLTGRPYRLPSEAEWEYACRAGTTTPFHFGETITPDLANYDGNYTYGAGPKGVYRKETTPVGSFPANAFGLYDMHGNVWEWCLDHWHGDYKGAPTDGSAWVTGGDSDRWLLRGGSWFDTPRDCRSACRYDSNPGNRDSGIGFRVVCAAARTLA